VKILIYYAQLNNDNIVVCVSSLHSEVSNDYMVMIDKPSNYLGKKYENGEFIEIPKTLEQIQQELKDEYLPKINEAQLLGDITEVTRLQQEYLEKKSEIEARYTS